MLTRAVKGNTALPTKLLAGFTIIPLILHLSHVSWPWLLSTP